MLHHSLAVWPWGWGAEKGCQTLLLDPLYEVLKASALDLSWFLHSE